MKKPVNPTAHIGTWFRTTKPLGIMPKGTYVCLVAIDPWGHKNCIGVQAKDYHPNGAPHITLGWTDVMPSPPPPPICNGSCPHCCPISSPSKDE